MRKLNFDKLYFLYFNLFLFLAGVISIYEKYFIILAFVFLTCFIFYFPYIFGFVNKFVKLSFFEYFLVVFIYFLIFLRNFNLVLDFGFDVSTKFIFRILLNLFVSFVLAIIGFFVIYFFGFKKDNFSRNRSGFLIFFMFCFSISFVTFFEVIRFTLFYFFEINFLSYNLSASLGFLSIHFLGSFLVCVFVFLYLVDGDDKHKILFYFKNFFGIKKQNVDNLFDDSLKLIEKGESDFVEFKETLRINIYTGKVDKRMEHSVLKTLVAFLNSGGGVLFVGVTDLGEIVGLGRDNFVDVDKCKLQVLNMIKHSIGVDYSSLIKVSEIYFDEELRKYFLRFDVKKSKSEVFLLWEKKEEFYIRSGPASINISGKSLIRYILAHFKK